MSDNNCLDFSGREFQFPAFETSELLRSVNEASAAMAASFEAEAESKRKKDAALFQTAKASMAQQKLLEQQLQAAQEQNKQLVENNALLRGLYEAAKADADSSAKDAKANMRFAWISLAVGSVIGIAGVIVGIIF